MKNILRPALASLIALFCYSTSFAVLTTHNWLESHRGYSIELVPGTGGTTGNAAEYVAAGTVYDGTNTPAWHFMHLDATGAVIDQRISYVTGDLKQEFRVVDIACESGNAFRIIIQARSYPVFTADYIYIAGVHKDGTDLPPANNPAIAITSNSTYKNLYPTHSYYAENNYLYICGYATQDTEYPQEPHEHSSDKIGMLLKVHVNSATPVVSASDFWNTNAGTDGLDYDMALKIAPYQYGETFPLLVTGAANDGLGNAANTSTALAIKFDANAVALQRSSIFATSFYSGSNLGAGTPRGVYGIDIRGGVYGGSLGGVIDPDVVVALNFFEVLHDLHLPDRSYGIARIQNDLTERAVGASLKYTRGVMYAKQFLELHGNSTQPSVNNHIYIVGETMEVPGICYTGSLPSGSLPSSGNNINPFISYWMFGNGEYYYTTGFNTSSLTQIGTNIYLSSQSTTATNMDYYAGTGIGIRDDIRRLYTFASLERHYDDPTVTNPPISEPAMVLPIADGTSPDLKTKFLSVTAPFYDEEVCEKYVDDCTNTYYMEIDTKTDHFSQVANSLSVSNAYSMFSLTNNSYDVSKTDCDSGDGIFKPGRTTGIADVTNSTTFEVFPNPASNMLNINFGAMQDNFTVSITDAQGKVVLQKEGKSADKISLSLPELSAGVYLVNIVTDKSTQTTKVTISK